jgi:hypothetical protein
MSFLRAQELLGFKHKKGRTTLINDLKLEGLVKDMKAKEGMFAKMQKKYSRTGNRTPATCGLSIRR